MSTWINSIGSGLVEEQWRRKEETVCVIDLSRHRSHHYSLGSESNTIEVKVIPAAGADPVIARWVIAPPLDPHGWRQPGAGAAAPVTAEAAGLSPEGVSVVEVLDDGRRFPLELGLTASRRVAIQASFTNADASIGLRLRWTGADERVRQFADGAQVVAGDRGVRPVEGGTRTLEVSVDLDLGPNRLEVEVLHGEVVLTSSTYRILRQRPNRPGDVDGDRWAVVVGISSYRDEAVSDLRYAHRDAMDLRDVLVTRGGFAPERVLTLVEAAATLQNIRSAMATYLSRTKPEDLVLLFLAGHGVSDPRNLDNHYFLAHDSRLDSLSDTAFPLWDIGSAMGFTIRARKILVLADTCHSGGALEAGTLDASGLNFVNKYLETLASRKGRLILTASQAHERSLERDEVGHGVFTNRVLVGLRGAADTDRNNVVTVQELIDYVRESVPADTRGQQHPSYRELEFDMNIALAFDVNR